MQIVIQPCGMKIGESDLFRSTSVHSFAPYPEFKNREFSRKDHFASLKILSIYHQQFLFSKLLGYSNHLPI